MQNVPTNEICSELLNHSSCRLAVYVRLDTMMLFPAHTDHYTGSPQVFADPTQVTGITGEPLSLVCYVAGLSNSSYRVRWFDNNGMVFNSDKLSISEATTDNTSVYICEVIAGGETYTATSYVTVTGKGMEVHSIRLHAP